MLCLFQVLHLGGINFIIPRAFSALLKSVSPTVTLEGLNILVEVVVELVLLVQNHIVPGIVVCALHALVPTSRLRHTAFVFYKAT